jgi:hypothetical protein
LSFCLFISLRSKSTGNTSKTHPDHTIYIYRVASMLKSGSANLGLQCLWYLQKE